MKCGVRYILVLLSFLWVHLSAATVFEGVNGCVFQMDATEYYRFTIDPSDDRVTLWDGAVGQGQVDASTTKHPIYIESSFNGINALDLPADRYLKCVFDTPANALHVFVVYWPDSAGQEVLIDNPDFEVELWTSSDAAPAIAVGTASGLTDMDLLFLGKTYNGKVAEVVVFDHQLSVVEEQLVYDRLNVKWIERVSRDIPNLFKTVLGKTDAEFAVARAFVSDHMLNGAFATGANFRGDPNNIFRTDDSTGEVRSQHEVEWLETILLGENNKTMFDEGLNQFEDHHWRWDSVVGQWYFYDTVYETGEEYRSTYVGQGNHYGMASTLHRAYAKWREPRYLELADRHANFWQAHKKFEAPTNAKEMIYSANNSAGYGKGILKMFEADSIGLNAYTECTYMKPMGHRLAVEYGASVDTAFYDAAPHAQIKWLLRSSHPVTGLVPATSDLQGNPVEHNDETWARYANDPTEKLWDRFVNSMINYPQDMDAGLLESFNKVAAWADGIGVNNLLNDYSLDGTRDDPTATYKNGGATEAGIASIAAMAQVVDTDLTPWIQQAWDDTASTPAKRIMKGYVRDFFIISGLAQVQNDGLRRNYVSNSGLETPADLTGWDVSAAPGSSVSSGSSRRGSYGLACSDQSPSPELDASAFQAGATYLYTAWVRSASGTHTYHVDCQLDGSGGPTQQQSTAVSIGTDWQEVQLSFVLPVGESTTSISIQVLSDSSTAFDLDDINIILESAPVGPVQSMVSGGGNTPPQFTSDPVVEVNAPEDAAYNGTLADNASDLDSDPLFFSRIAGPSWLNVASDGTLSGIPSNVDVGLNSWTVQVSDGADADTATLNITVDNLNDAPVFTSDPINEANGTENQSYSGSISGNASDPESDPMTFSKVGGPAWLSVASNGSLSGTPGAGDVGGNAFTLQVSATGGSDTATLNITVDPGGTQELIFNVIEDTWVNSANTSSNYGTQDRIKARTAGTDYASLVKFNVALGGGSVISAILEVTGSNATYPVTDPRAEVCSSTSWSETGVTWGTRPTQGAQIDVATGTFSAGQTAQLDVTSQVTSDGLVAFYVDSAQGNQGWLASRENATYAAAKLIVTVTNGGGGNQPPAFTSNPINKIDADEGQAYSSSIADNASDPESDSMTFSKVSGPAWLSVASNGSLSGTPGAGDVGANAFTVQVDATGGSDTATLNITVNGVPGGPSSDDANADIIVAGTVSGSYADTASSDDTYESITEIESGGNPNNRYSYLEHKWTINVAGGNSVTFYVEAYKTANSEGDDFVFAYSTDDSSYTDMVTVTKTSDDDAAQQYTLPSSVSGTVYIRVTDTDSTAGNKNLDTVYVDEMYILSDGEPPANAAPSFSSDPVVEANAAESSSYSSSIADNASDPESDPMTFSKVFGPAWLSVASNGSLSGTPGAGDVGLNSFTVQVDATGGSDTATLEITVDAAGSVTDIYIADIAMSSSTGGGNRIKGIATITVNDEFGAVVPNATVSVDWSGATSESDSGVTDGSGIVVLESSSVKNGGTYTVTVTDVTASGSNYNPALNVETSDSITAQ